MRCPIFFLTAILTLSTFAANDIDTVVGPIATNSGPIIGQLHPADVKSFLGIPYAKPPVGELRWTYTKRPDPWTEPRQCTNFSPVCPQPTVPLYGDLGPSSEDCLYLNVWTTAKVTTKKVTVRRTNKDGNFEEVLQDVPEFADEKRPVLFWIHGGGFAIGSASQKWYDGTHLANEGAVVVTINYRLGPLGFLSHPELSAETGGLGGANYGLHDIVEALYWTNNNIARFGGDPNNITVWGESAGAAAVSALLVAKLPTANLFQRAILMSTNTIVPLRYRNKPNGALQSMEELGVEFQKRLGVPDGPDALKQMREKSASDILKASRPGSAVPGVSTTDNICVDGNLLSKQITESFKNHSAKWVPILIGNVADEGSMFADPKRSKIDTLAKYKDFLTQRFAAKADQALALYPAGTDTEITPALSQLFADIFIRSTRMHTRTMLETGGGQKVFQYVFTHKDKPMSATAWSVYHGSELPYFFGTVDDKEKYTDEDRELSRLIRTYVLNFARTGNPNSPLFPQAPEWPAYSPDAERHLTLDTPITPGEKFHAKTLDALLDLEK